MVKQTLYKKIYNTVVEKIINNEYAEGDKLPTESELAQQYDVSRITSKKALDQLSEAGYIKRIQGKGSYVLKVDDVQLTTSVEMNNSKSIGNSDNHLLIGIVMSDFNSNYGLEILSGMERELEKNNSFMIVKRSYDDQIIEKKVVEELLGIGVDGLIIIPVHGEFYNPTILKLILQGFPVVVVDRQLTGIPASFVGTNNTIGAKNAVDYLFRQGYRNITFVSASLKNTPLKDRVEGIKISHSENGAVWDENKLWITDVGSYVHGENTETKEQKYKELVEKIKESPEITCFFALEYGIANFIKKALVQLGKRIPEDVGIICFDEPKSYTGDSYFTHIRQDEENMGRWAIKLLIEQLTKDQKNGKQKILDTQLIIGETTK